MNKVNIFIVLRDHIATLYDDTTEKFSYGDLAFFYLLPLVFGVLYFLFPFPLPSEVNGALIAVFSVFAALLFSAQMALYGLSPREPHCGKDDTSDARERARFERDRKFFADANYNVSYLILLSCLSLLIFVAMMIASLSGSIEGAVLVVLVSHFFLTLLMLVKRTHIAFSSKYNG
jgi:hypothetical protein